jgi:hypothetical protein
VVFEPDSIKTPNDAFFLRIEQEKKKKKQVHGTGMTQKQNVRKNATVAKVMPMHGVQSIVVDLTVGAVSACLLVVSAAAALALAADMAVGVVAAALLGARPAAAAVEIAHSCPDSLVCRADAVANAVGHAVEAGAAEGYRVAPYWDRI